MDKKMETNDGTGVRLLSALGLIVTTMIWGGSFVVMKNSVDILEPTFLLAVRFSLGAFFLAALFYKKLALLNRDSLRCGVILGILLGLSYLFQTYGIKYTTASKNAFITTLYVIIVPFLHWLINKKKPKKNNVTAAAMGVIGLALLTLEGNFAINLGDFLTLVSGFCFAFHMVYIDRYTENHDPILLTIIQVAVVGIANWFLVPVLDGPGAYQFGLFADVKLISGILYLAVFCTMFGFLMQNVCQKYLSANTASLLLSMESVFGTLFSVILLNDILTGKMLAGCCLMFLAVILSEMHIKTGRA